MKVNGKIITEISTHIPQSTKKATEPIGGKELVDEKKLKEQIDRDEMLLLIFPRLQNRLKQLRKSLHLNRMLEKMRLLS